MVPSYRIIWVSVGAEAIAAPECPAELGAWPVAVSLALSVLGILPPAFEGSGWI